MTVYFFLIILIFYEQWLIRWRVEKTVVSIATAYQIAHIVLKNVFKYI